MIGSAVALDRRRVFARPAPRLPGRAVAMRESHRRVSPNMARDLAAADRHESVRGHLLRAVPRAGPGSQRSVEALADIIDNAVQSREAFEKTSRERLAGERALVAFRSGALGLDELAGDELQSLLQPARGLHRRSSASLRPAPPLHVVPTPWRVCEPRCAICVH